MKITQECSANMKHKKKRTSPDYYYGLYGLFCIFAHFLLAFLLTNGSSPVLRRDFIEMLLTVGPVSDPSALFVPFVSKPLFTVWSAHSGDLAFSILRNEPE